MWVEMLKVNVQIKAANEMTVSEIPVMIFLVHK